MRKMKRKFSIILALALVLSLVLPSVVLAAPVVRHQISNELTATITVEEVDLTTVYVDANVEEEGDGSKESPFQTIGQGIEQVARGGTVHVSEGTYDETVNISKSLILQGANMENVKIKGHITVWASDVTVQGFTIEKTEQLPVITLKGGSNIEIKNNKVNGNNDGGKAKTDAGILVESGPSITITDNAIINNTGNGIWVDLSDSDVLTIENNTIEANRTGINFNSFGKASVTIKDNSFKKNNAHGISIGAGSAQATFTITGNTFDGNVRSHFSDRRYDNRDDAVAPSKGNIVANNTIKGPWAWAWSEDGGSSSDNTRWLLVGLTEGAMELSWVENETNGEISNNHLTVNVGVGEEIEAVISTKLNQNVSNEGAIDEIPSVLFVMEIEGEDDGSVGKDKLVVVAGDGQNVGYDEDGDFWYWGPREGFTFSGPDSIATKFTYKFSEADTYNVTIYAVQLNEDSED